LAGSKIVESDHALAERQQGFEQIAADEARDARHQPGTGIGLELQLDRFVGHEITRARA
jgi:hypothetical protein